MTSDDEATPKPTRRARATSGGQHASSTGSGDLVPASGAQASTPAVAEDGAAIQADHVSVRQAAVGRVDSEHLVVVQGAVGGARAGSVAVQQGALGGALAGELTVRQSFARSILAREARVEQSFVRMLSAVEVRIERSTFVGVLVARRVVGDVRVLVDWRGAAAFGAAFGLVAGLVGRARGRGTKED